MAQYIIVKKVPSVTESVSDGSFIGVGCNIRVSKHGSTYHCEV